MQYYGIFKPFKSQVYSKHGGLIFFLFESWSLVLYLHVLVKTVFCSDNSNLKSLVDIKRFHENGKWIVCASDGVYIFLKKTFLLLFTALLKCFIYVRTKVS